MMLITDTTSRNLWIAMCVFLLMTFIIPNWLGFLTTVALAKGLVVLGLAMLMRTGLVSFGQGLYYCLGGYVVGIAGTQLGITDVIILLAITIISAIMISLLLGLLLCRYREIFFAMLTMAFSMILYGILVKSEVLGSTDGFNIEPASLMGWHPAIESLGTWVYMFTVVLTFLILQCIHRYFKSPLGFTGKAIRENEIRVEYLGISPKKVILLKYVIAAVLASVGGALTAMVAGHVDPEMAFWTTSGEFVFIALLGGITHVAAPIVGAIIFEIIRTFAFDLAPYSWQMILGAALLLIIFFLPNGLWSLLPAQRNGGQL